MRGSRVKKLRNKIINDFGAGEWRRFSLMRNGQVLNVGLGGMFRKLKKAWNRGEVRS